MFEPWDGIWTYELLRDLCGGVTRGKGEFRATGISQGRKYFTTPSSSPIKVEREGGTSYRVNGGDWTGRDEAVTELTRLQAVPVNDDGKQWKIRREELLPEGVCEVCEGDGEYECETCEGEGSQECSLGHDHDCEDCDATGVVKCSCALQAKSRLQLTAKV